MVPDLLVFFIIIPMPPLVGLDSQNRVPDELPVVNSPPVRAVAVRCIERVVVDEAHEVGRQRIPHRNFLCVLVDHRRPRVLRKLTFEAAGAVPVVAHLVLFLPAVAVRPGYALDAAPAAAVLNALVSRIPRALNAASLDAAPAAAVLNALVGRTDCALSAASLDAAPAAAVLLALVGRIPRALSAASLDAAPAAAVLNALVGLTLRALSAASLDAARWPALLALQRGRARERSFAITVYELEGWARRYNIYCCVVNRMAVDWRHLHLWCNIGFLHAN